jgi:diaminopimelate decarboxylase
MPSLTSVLSSTGPTLFVGSVCVAVLALASTARSNKSRKSTNQQQDDDRLELARFITSELAQNIKSQFGTPVFVYDERSLISQATLALAFPNLFGLTVRFAMKACPNANVLRLFHALGLHFDASSGFEVKRAIAANIPAEKVSLSSQELPSDFEELFRLGIHFNACSLQQLVRFGKLFPGGKCGIRFNPGRGSGGTGKTVRVYRVCVCVCV